MLCYKYLYMINICYINSVILYLHQTNNPTKLLRWVNVDKYSNNNQTIKHDGG